MKTEYKIVGYLAFSEKDDFERGCVGPSKSEFCDRFTISASTLRELLDLVKSEFRATSDEDLLLDSCEEDGRLDLQVTQIAPFKIGKPSEKSLALWKEGKKDLWLTCYSFQVVKIETGFSLTEDLNA